MERTMITWTGVGEGRTGAQQIAVEMKTDVGL